MIRITDRKLIEGEHARILADCDQILLKAGVLENGFMSYSLVADEDGQMIGFVSGLKNHKWLYLSDMWIEETHRRQGIGSRLLKDFEDRIKSCGIEHIYLWTYGPINQKFYEKNGYCQFTVFEDFYEVKGYHQIGYRKDFY